MNKYIGWAVQIVLAYVVIKLGYGVLLKMYNNLTDSGKENTDKPIDPNATDDPSTKQLKNVALHRELSEWYVEDSEIELHLRKLNDGGELARVYDYFNTVSTIQVSGDLFTCINERCFYDKRVKWVNEGLFYQYASQIKTTFL
jgi:hypothetical protein